jgi:ABC-2 type transport system ATP-binding protein
VALRTAAGKAAIGPVIRALGDRGVEVEFVEVETPTLDDVFMAVTGSHLEGAEQPEAEAA